MMWKITLKFILDSVSKKKNHTRFIKIFNKTFGQIFLIKYTKFYM